MKNEVNNYKTQLRIVIEDRIRTLLFDKIHNGFTDEQNYVIYVVVAELQMVLEKMHNITPTELCDTCGRNSVDVTFCSNSFHLIGINTEHTAAHNID